MRYGWMRPYGHTQWHGGGVEEVAPVMAEIVNLAEVRESRKFSKLARLAKIAAVIMIALLV